MLRKRIISAIGMLLALFAAAFLLPPVGILILIMALSMLGLLEYGRLLRAAGIQVYTGIMLLGGVLLNCAAFIDRRAVDQCGYAGGFAWEIAVLALCLLMVMIRALRQKAETATWNAAVCSLAGLLYLPMLLNFYMRLALIDTGMPDDAAINWRIPALFPIIVVKVSDMGAYFAGRALGGRKLCPRLSPAKTWSGFAGGLVAALAVAMFFSFVINPPTDAFQALWRPLPMAICALLLAVAGVAGDLIESFLKRVAAVKDSSGVLPGMGGVLDVLDSLLFSAPLFYVIVRLTAC